MKDKPTLRWLYVHSKKHLWAVALLALLRCALTILGVTFALTSRHVVDSAVSKDMDGLIHSSLGLLFIILTQIIIRLVGKASETYIGAKLRLKLRNQVFFSVLKKDYSIITSYHTGDLLTRLNNDVSIISTGILSLIPQVLGLLSGLAYALYSLTILDMNFAFIFFFGGILLLIIIGAFRKLLKNTHKKIQETEAIVRSFFQETFGSLLMIKVFGIEERMSKRAEQLQDDNFRAQMVRRNISIISSTGLGMIFSLGSLYALVWSSYRLFLGAITFGSLTAILQLVNQIQAPFANLSGVVPQYYSILASAERIIEIDNLPDEREAENILEPKSAYETLRNICFENVSFKYDREFVLENANLTIEKGDFAVIAGISGIGKSTLFKLLLGVLNPENGEITLDFGDRREIAGKHSRPLFSYVPQGNLLLSGTIREAVSLIGENISDEEIMKAAQISCATDFISKLPDGLDTYIGEKGLGLSEGQFQRLAIMRALLSGAPIILLDEATSALDEETEKKFLENLKGLENKTCIIISHKHAAFEICNKHIFIDDKKIRVEIN